MTSKKTPFIYRSFFNFWLAFILPASLVTTVVFQLLNKGSIDLAFFKLPSTLAKILIFQLIFGTWTYFKEYRPKSQKYKEDT
jgi:ABC-type uncharacterized transport system permease subunit